MPVSSCPHCRKSISAPVAAAGRSAKCPHCGKGFILGPWSPFAPRKDARAPAKSPRFTRRTVELLAGGGAVLAVASLIGLWLRGSPQPKDEFASPPETKLIVPEEPVKKAPANNAAPPPHPKAVPPSPAPMAVADQLSNLTAHLNEMRKAAKLPAVALDAELSHGCQAHADYIATNRADAKLAAAAGLQDEDPALPGYHEEGKKAARASLLAFAEPNKAFELWLGRLNSRPSLLHPDLERIGFGAARSASGEWICVLDVTRGHGATAVAYPAPDQANVPLNFSGGAEAVSAFAGFPVSLQFPPGKTPASISAVLTDDLGNRVATSLSTPEQPLPGVRRPGLIGMIPIEPLSGKSTYHVRIAGQSDDRPFVKQWEFTTEDDGDETGAWSAKMLERLNRVRRQADLPLVELDDELSRACRLHAKYLVVNAHRPEVQGMGAHAETAKLPFFTPEGAKAAKASDIAIGDYEPIDALDGWMATLYHRVPILEPGLRKIGFGCARGQRLGWATVLDVASGRDQSPRSRPVFWPVDGQTEVPLHFPPGGEIPNPIPDDKTGRAGYPITAFFPFQAPLLKAQAKLEDVKGQPAPCWFSSIEAPANPKFEVNQGTTICLIPKESLRPEQSYRVTITGEQKGAAWKKSWSFTTAKSGPSASDAVKLAVQRFNQAREMAGLPAVRLDADLSKGCQAHAEYLIRNSGPREAKGFSLIDEDPTLPGYSLAGQNAARRADVYSLAPSPTMQIDDLLGTLSRRSLVLDPRLRRIGLGCALEEGRGWINVLDLNSGREDGDPIVYPGIGQDRVPIQGHDRVPSEPKEFAGFPITVWFPGRPVIRNARATLAESTGTTVDIWLSAPDAPFAIGVSQPNVIGIHPLRPLRPGRIYAVTVSAEVDGVEWRHTSRFATADP